MAFSLRQSSSVLSLFGGYLRVSLLGQRRWVMNSKERGVSEWKNNEAKGEGIDIGSLSEQVMRNLEKSGCSKCSELNKIFDNVTTVEQLNNAEKVLLSFRRGSNPIRPSTPRVVVRACIRVGRPNRALHFIRHKVQYGIFPSVNVYNTLMDAFLNENNYKAIVSTYQEMVKSELKVNSLSHFLVVFGYLFQEDANMGTDLEVVKIHCSNSMASNKKIGFRAYHMLIKVLVERDDRENVQEVLEQLDSNYPELYNTFDANWRVRGFVYLNNIDKIYNIVDKVCASSSLSLSEEVYDCIEEYIKKSTDEPEQYLSKLRNNREKILTKEKKSC